MLRIYKEASPDSPYSNDDSFANPFSVALDGSTGQFLTRLLYVRNDDSSKSYEDIEVSPLHVSGVDVSGTQGFSWKMIAGNSEPSEIQWSITSPSNDIVLPDLGTEMSSDINTYLPFWIRIEIPKGASVTSHQGVRLRLSFKELAI